jgi:uncharacterized phage protein gp47/JayE
VSFEPRSYEDIVRDMLTTLTGGTVRETLRILGSEPIITLEKLKDRPVRRISHLKGEISVGAGPNARTIPYQFTAADFELVSSDGDESNKDSIRFRDGGRRPAPDTSLTVNYYPVQTSPTPLTDLNVGSVVRTMTETIAREMAMAHLQLNHVYDSAFVETATDTSLDKVVALVGVRRLRQGYPVVKLRFSRRPDATGAQVTIPANTPVTNASGHRYLTLDNLTLEPGESAREISARGEFPGTRLAEAGELSRMEVLIAGVAEVTNPQPAYSLNAPETDDALRRRAAAGLHGVTRGTLDALRFNLLSIEGVKNVNIVEAPNGVPGEIRVEVAHGGDDPTMDGAIQRTIDAIRPAGIRVLWGQAANQRVAVRVNVTLAGSGLAGGALAALNNEAETRLRAYLTGLPPGARARRAQMLRLVLEDPQITDAQVTLLPEGAGETEELQLPANTIIEVRSFVFPAPTFEDAGDGTATSATVSVLLPIHLVAGVTRTQATSAITPSIDSYLARRNPGAPLDVDGMVAAVRDDTRFAIVRSEVVVTVEGGGRFWQLSDGVGQYALAENESLQKGEVTIDLREGDL